MGKINKLGKWVPRNLNERQMKKNFNATKGNKFLHQIVIVVKMDLYEKPEVEKNIVAFTMAKPVHLPRPTNSLR